MGSIVKGMCSQQSDYCLRTETFTNKCEAERVTSEASEWTNSYKSANLKVVNRESVIRHLHPIVPDVI